MGIKIAGIVIEDLLAHSVWSISLDSCSESATFNNGAPLLNIEDWWPLDKCYLLIRVDTDAQRVRDEGGLPDRIEVTAVAQVKAPIDVATSEWHRPKFFNTLG